MTKLDPNHKENIIIIDDALVKGLDQQDEIRVACAQKAQHEASGRRYGNFSYCD
jgi:hypothetical protein